MNIPSQRSLLHILLLFLALFVAGCTREEALYDHLQENGAALDIPASEDSRLRRFTVEPGTPARNIAEQLAKVGLIRDAELFEAYVRATDMAPRLQAGTFFLSANMTPVEIAEILQDGQAAGISVTIPEGWRLEQIADLLDDRALVSGQEYLHSVQMPDVGALAKTPSSKQTAVVPRVDPPACCAKAVERWPFLNERPAAASLEGFLFPATYQLPAEAPTANDLIARQLDAFADQVLPIYKQAQSENEQVPDLYTALVLASIVEREAVIPAERPTIAGVYLNRLEAGMRLEADATVQYAMGYQPNSDQWWKTPVFLEEYGSVVSPYNTYTHAGIPPGPIANPGLDAFRAVLYPERHDYLFYVATPDDSGAHVFAQTWAEHVENVRRYQGR